MLKALPVFSERFHLSPSEFWSLTFEEFDAYMDRLRTTQGPSEIGEAV